MTTNKLGLTPAQIAERLAATDDAVASVELEGLNENPHGINEVLYAFARGEITLEERAAKISEIVRKIQDEDAALPPPPPRTTL
ncbi:MAG: antitoxin VbhA family protein [bacterium]|jgi:hypothetical protein